jgi:3-oxoacyl-[acyl-carrier-protein] synthase II
MTVGPLKRVVITGLGVVSPGGIGNEDFWNTIRSGKNCISRIERIDTSDLEIKIAGEIKGFDPADYLEVDSFNDDGQRVALLASCAAKQAIQDSGIDLTEPERAGICLGTSAGGLETSVGRLLRRLRASDDEKGAAFELSDLASILPGNLCARVMQSLPVKAICLGISTGCTASADAIGYGYEHIKGGIVDVMLVGGSEAPIEPITIQAFDAIGALSRRNDPDSSSRPFDKGRDGFVIAEGAAVLVLEEMDHAVRRGAHLYAEIVAYQTSCDAYHLTGSDPAMVASAKVILSALKEAGLEREQVDYVTAHGSSTPMNDARETSVIKSAFGNHAYSIPITGLKSMLGHASGAAAAIQAAGAVLAMKHGFLPPTINYRTPDPTCDLDYVPNVGRAASINVVLQNTYAYSGKNAAILYRQTGSVED